jgi:F-type H+-transporting ATPase subunit a
MRPMHSDVNTTLVLSLITLYTLLFVQVRTHGAGRTLGSYLFNFSGHSFSEKVINVAVGWLHFIGLPATAVSLSLRLFGNIFAGVVLIGVISFLLATATSSLFEVGRIFSLPFWFFEVFVALVQAIVFTGLMVAYFKQAGEAHH